MKTLLWAAGPVLALSSCASIPMSAAAGELSLKTLPPDAVVTVTRVKRPWYAARFLLMRGFRKSLPEYQAISGLERKSYCITGDGGFGGVYRWRSRADAEKWFDAKWFERTERVYGERGGVRWFAATRVLEREERAVEEGPMWVTLGPGPLESYASADGLRSATEVGEQVISVWLSRDQAERHLGDSAKVEWLEAPLALTNR